MKANVVHLAVGDLQVDRRLVGFRELATRHVSVGRIEAREILKGAGGGFGGLPAVRERTGRSTYVGLADGAGECAVV